MPRLDVGDGHELHYELHGSSTGRPVVVLHGGPGGGLQRWILKLFNLRKWRVLLYDQRGAGRSTPSGSLHANTTWNLVDDLELLRTNVMDTPAWAVFGGSWGSTLALAYASRHPSVITAMILRGVYLGMPSENDWMFSAKGNAALRRPRSWNAFSKGGNGCRTTRACLSAYAKRIRNRRTRKAAVNAWNKWEADLSNLSVTPNEYPLAAIENHYFRNGCWLQPGELLAAAPTMTMPVVIVQGRYDLVCPPSSAAALADALPNVRLIWTNAGHPASELETAAELRKATDWILHH